MTFVLSLSLSLYHILLELFLDRIPAMAHQLFTAEILMYENCKNI